MQWRIIGRAEGTGLAFALVILPAQTIFDPPNQRCNSIHKAGAHSNKYSAYTENIAQRWHQQRSVCSASWRPVNNMRNQKSKKTADSINSRLALVMYVRLTITSKGNLLIFDFPIGNLERVR